MASWVQILQNIDILKLMQDAQGHKSAQFCFCENFTSLVSQIGWCGADACITCTFCHFHTQNPQEPLDTHLNSTTHTQHQHKLSQSCLASCCYGPAGQVQWMHVSTVMQNINRQARIMHNHSAAWWNRAPERRQLALLTTAIPTNKHKI